MRTSVPSARTIGAHRSRGATAVEFALVSIIFFTLVLGIVDFGRWLFTLNTASETTRLGARVAVVCDLNSPAIVRRMQQMMPDLTRANVGVEYQPAACNVSNCASVTVRLSDVTIQGVAWFLPGTLPIPAFTTTLPRESLLSAIDGSANPQCS